MATVLCGQSQCVERDVQVYRLADPVQQGHHAVGIEDQDERQFECANHFHVYRVRPDDQ